jgi:hypothetical protein
MKCHTNLNSTPPTESPHTFLYTVAILIHNHFESLNTLYVIKTKDIKKTSLDIFVKNLIVIVHMKRRCKKGPTFKKDGRDVATNNNKK